MTSVVFISYSHDSAAHEQRVLALADQLRDKGVDVRLDQYEPHPAEGRPRWLERQVRESRFVLLVCTEAYRRGYDRDGQPDGDHDARWESLIAERMLFEAGAYNERLIPILLDGGAQDDIPPSLRSFSFHRLPQDYDNLYRRLTGQPRTPPRPIGKVEAMPTTPRPGVVGLDSVPFIGALPGHQQRDAGAMHALEHSRVRLRIEGATRGNEVHWRYVHADRNEALAPAPPGSLGTVRRALDALERGNDDDSARALGRTLAECLLGARGSDDYHARFRRLFGYGQSETPSAVALPVACRIVTRDPVLRRLPWRLCCEGERWLVDDGWTFEVGVEERPLHAIELPNPCTVVVIAPEHGPHASWTAQHYSRVLELLRDGAWPFLAGRIEPYVLRVRTRDELDEVLADRRPHLAYVAAELGGGEHSAVFLDDYKATERVPLAELVPQLAKCGVQALCLAGPGAGTLEIQAEWSHLVPAIVAPKGGSDPAAVDRAGLSWLHGLLVDSLDPVAAAHRVPSAGPSLWWAAAQVYGDFRSWNTARVPPSPDFKEAVLRIDRRKQRSSFVDRVVQLARESGPRVVSFLAHGTREDRVELLGDQLHQHLDDQGVLEPGDRGLRVHRRKIRFPPAGGGLLGRLEAALRSHVDIRGDEDPADAIRRMIANDPPRWAATVLWLDWGHVGVGARVKAIDAEDLAVWLKFGAESLPPLCPSQGLPMRVLSTLTVALREQDMDPFESEVRALRQEPGMQTSAAVVEALPALDRVEEGDLEQILHRPALKCPPDLVIPAAHAVVRLSKGRYAEAAELIREARNGGTWTELVQRVAMHPSSSAPRRRSRGFGEF